MDLITLALSKKGGSGGSGGGDVQRIIDGAPEGFDTLKEISDWIGQHEEEFQDIKDSAGGAIPDWEQSDPDAPDYIKNKPIEEVGPDSLLLLVAITPQIFCSYFLD